MLQARAAAESGKVSAAVKASLAADEGAAGDAKDAAAAALAAATKRFLRDHAFLQRSKVRGGGGGKEGGLCFSIAGLFSSIFQAHGSIRHESIDPPADRIT